MAAEFVAAHLSNDDGLTVEHAWESSAAGDAAAVDYECLVLLGWPSPSNRQRLKRIELYCRGGGPLVALRTLDAEMPGWPDFAEEVFGGRQAGRAAKPPFGTPTVGTSPGTIPCLRAWRT